MPAETKPKTFTKGGNPLRTWGKGLADVLGVKVVNEQSQAPKPEFATANTVNPNAPTLGEVQTAQADFGLKTLSESPVSSVSSAPEGSVSTTPRDSLGVPAAAPENNLNSVPVVPAAVSENTLNQVPPMPVAAESTIINNPVPESTNTIAPNPTEIPPMSPTIPEVPEPVAAHAPEPEIVTSQAPVPEPDEKTDTSSMPEPKIVDIKEAESPTIVPPSMGAPTIVSDVPPVETTKPEVTPAPDVFQSAFQDESQDHLDPTADSGAQPEPENTNSEFKVQINPIAEKLIKERPREFISMDANGKPTFDAVKFDEQLFVKEVQEEPTFKNLLNQLGKRGVSMETTIDALKQLIEA